MKRAYYAIYYGGHPKKSEASKPNRITSSWETCKQLTKGVSHVVYKKCSSRSEAEAFLEGLGEQGSGVEDDGVQIYVDGSFVEGFSSAAWAWAAVRGDEVVAEDKGLVAGPALSRNIDGECEATKQALLWAKKRDLSVLLVYDYMGIKNWLDGSWKPKSVVAKAYVREVLPLSESHRFKKTISHAGDKWNNYVDRLAKSVFEERGVF